MRIAKVVLIVAAAAGMSTVPFASHAQSGGITLPDTPAATILRAWLEAFNSGDSLRLDAYYRQYEPNRFGPPAVAAQRSTGGFDLVTVESRGPQQIEATLKERSTGAFSYGIITTPSNGTKTVRTFRLLPLGGTGAAARVDAAMRASVIEGAVAKLDEWYVFPAIAKEAGDSLRARLARGAYESYTSRSGFATRLHDELRELSRDKHMGFGSAPEAPPSPSTAPGAVATQQSQTKAGSCGFVKVEVLPGNIGYLKLNGFASPNACAAVASEAMDSLATTDALIVDLRDNGGGSPPMVAHLSSYLFGRKTHLNDLWDRKSGKTVEYWTSEDVPGRKFGGEKPVYVLTATKTFSAAEEFSYNLKSLKRATLVGETTGGGAHPVTSVRIENNFMITVPSQRAINPITKTNWEGVGVEPDVKVPASEAMATALKLIADKRRKGTQSEAGVNAPSGTRFATPR